MQTLQSGQAGSAIVSAVNKTKPKVDVSRRWGVWDSGSLSLSAETACGLPSFVDLGGARCSVDEPAPSAG